MSWMTILVILLGKVGKLYNINSYAFRKGALAALTTLLNNDSSAAYAFYKYVLAVGGLRGTASPPLSIYRGRAGLGAAWARCGGFGVRARANRPCA
jgi:hypothetical protein